MQSSRPWGAPPPLEETRNGNGAANDDDDDDDDSGAMGDLPPELAVTLQSIEQKLRRHRERLQRSRGGGAGGGSAAPGPHDDSSATSGRQHDASDAFISHSRPASRGHGGGAMRGGHNDFSRENEIDGRQENEGAAAFDDRRGDVRRSGGVAYESHRERQPIERRGRRTEATAGAAASDWALPQSHDVRPRDAARGAGGHHHARLTTDKAREWSAMIRERRTLTPPLRSGGGESSKGGRERGEHESQQQQQWAARSEGAGGSASASGPVPQLEELTELRVMLREQALAHEREAAARAAEFEAKAQAAREVSERRVAQAYQEGVESCTRQRDELRARADRAAVELEALQVSVRDLRSKLEKAQREGAAARREAQEAQAQGADALATIKTLEGEVRRLTQRASVAEDQRMRLQTECDHLSNALQPLRERDEARRAELQEARDELLRARHEREALERDYSARMGDFEERFRRTNEEMAVFCERVDATNAQHAAKEQALRERLARRKDEVKELRARAGTAEAELAMVQQERAEAAVAHANETAALREELEARSAALETAQRGAKAGAEEAALKTREVVSSFEAKLAAAARDRAVTEDELREVRRQLERACEDVTAERQRVAQLEERLATHKKSAGAQMRNAASQHEADAAQIAELRREVDAVRAQLLKAQHDLHASTNLRGELSQQRAAREAAERDLAELRRRLRPMSSAAAAAATTTTTTTTTAANAANAAAAAAAAGRPPAYSERNRQQHVQRRTASPRQHDSSSDAIAVSSAASGGSARRIVHRASPPQTKTDRPATQSTGPVRLAAHEQLRRGLEELEEGTGSRAHTEAEPEVVRTRDAMTIQLMRSFAEHEARLREVRDAIAVPITVVSDEDDDDDDDYA